MAEVGAAPVKKLSVKALVKYLEKVLPITIDDVTNPKCERILDIYWCLCCHIYGESELLASMRSKEGSKRLQLTVILRQLFDKLLHEFQPGFTVGDVVFPTKDRTAIFLNAAMNFLKVLGENTHVRDKVLAERLDLERQEAELESAMLDSVERIRAAKFKRDESVKLCNQLKDQYLTLESKNESLTKKVAELQIDREKKKSILLQEKHKEAELRSEIKKADARIEFLEANILPPKAELEERLRELDSEAAEKEEQLEAKKGAITKMNYKLGKIEEHKAHLSLSFDLLKEHIQHTEKVRVKQELTTNVKELEVTVISLESELFNISSKKTEAEAAYLRMLEAEKKAWNHLKYLEESL